MSSHEAWQQFHCSFGNSLTLTLIVNQKRTEQYGSGCIPVKVRNTFSTVKDKKSYRMFVLSNHDCSFAGIG
ncbi:hypothetical protein D3C81_1981280 [compost metagenome]